MSDKTKQNHNTSSYLDMMWAIYDQTTEAQKNLFGSIDKNLGTNLKALPEIYKNFAQKFQKNTENAFQNTQDNHKKTLEFTESLFQANQDYFHKLSLCNTYEEYIALQTELAKKFDSDKEEFIGLSKAAFEELQASLKPMQEEWQVVSKKIADCFSI